jgi:hypothetical protein
MNHEAFPFQCPQNQGRARVPRILAIPVPSASRPPGHLDNPPLHYHYYYTLS